MFLYISKVINSKYENKLRIIRGLKYSDDVLYFSTKIVCSINKYETKKEEIVCGIEVLGYHFLFYMNCCLQVNNTNVQVHSLSQRVYEAFYTVCGGTLIRETEKDKFTETY